jgi:hypothetical protein
VGLIVLLIIIGNAGRQPALPEKKINFIITGKPLIEFGSK